MHGYNLNYYLQLQEKTSVLDFGKSHTTYSCFGGTMECAVVATSTARFSSNRPMPSWLDNDIQDGGDSSPNSCHSDLDFAAACQIIDIIMIQLKSCY